MNLIIQKLSPSFLVAYRVSMILGNSVIIFKISGVPFAQIFSHADKQECQGQNNQRDGTHAKQNECQNRKASFARPMRVNKRFVAERLNALAHRFEGVDHGRQCTPMHSGARKCVGGAL